MGGVFTVANVLIGVLATLVMDLGQAVGWKLGIAPPPPRPNGPAALGRWVGYISKGRFTHANILDTPKLRGEVIIGAATHYFLGIFITLGYFLVLRLAGVEPTFLNALVYGLVTVIFPWLIMFPALGAGWLGKEVPKLTRVALWNHTFYGLGLGLWISVFAGY